MSKSQEPVHPGLRSGFRSSEFWLALAAVIIGATLSSGLLAGVPVAVKVVGIAGTVLASMGYAVSRTVLKQDQDHEEQ